MQWVKKIYLYLVSVIALTIAVVGAIMLINLALRTWVFTKADQTYYSYPACPVAAPGTDVKAVPACDEAAQKKQADENKSSQRQSTAAQAIAMILVATPVWYYHWKMARKEV